MNNKECEIMKDLLPSYAEEICTEASREWVEEHLKNCEECRKTVALLKTTEISAKRLEQESLDAGRKVIRQNLRRSMLNLGLCLVMAFLMIFVFELELIQIPHLALYLVMPICMLITWLVCRNQCRLRGWDKWDTLSVAGVILATVYGAVMMFYGFAQAIKGETVFGLAPNGFGPFLYAQMVLAAVLCFAIYVLQMVRVVKNGRNNSILINLCLTGIFLMMAYCVYMGNLLSLEEAVELLKDATVTVLAEGAIGTICFVVLDKFAKK